MKKPAWYRRLPHVWQECVDQSLHFTAGLVLGFASPILSIVVEIIREWWQNYGDKENDAMDMLTDITVWTLGAVAASLVF